MPRTFVDLSIFLENDVVSDPPPFRPKIDYVDHKMSVPELAGFFLVSSFFVAHASRLLPQGDSPILSIDAAQILYVFPGQVFPSVRLTARLTPIAGPPSAMNPSISPIWLRQCAATA